MTHATFSVVHAPKSIPCTAQHLTFGGRCLNCGYDPEKNGTSPTNYQQGWKDGSLDRMFTGPLADVLIGKSAEYIRGYKDGIYNRFNP